MQTFSNGGNSDGITTIGANNHHSNQIANDINNNIPITTNATTISSPSSASTNVVSSSSFSLGHGSRMSSSTTSIGSNNHSSDSHSGRSSTSSTSSGGSSHGRSSSPPHILLENDVQFEVMELIANTRHSLVYRAFCTQTDSTVIIKIHKYEFPNSKLKHKYKKEFQVGQQFRGNPYIVQYLEMRQYGRRYAIIMQDSYCIPLCNALPKKACWNLGQFLKMAIQMVEGLSTIHQKGIIHQNITPRHLLVNVNTSSVKFSDFGLCSTLNKQYQPVINPKNFEYDLEYISPEQTGIHKDLDYRTDFYSLGVIFYEMITGVLPFSSNDSTKLIYSHIAKIPTPPDQINKSIPQVISNIILKLLEKNADDRYQSCYGLKMDLKQCLKLLNENGEIELFPICQHDVNSTFHIYQKLYGREQDITQLLDAFEEIASGTITSNLLLVSGYSGIGKTSLINEVQKPLVRDRGYFCSGKFDQFRRNIPYSSMIQAFQQLISTLLTEPEEKIQYWKEALLKALGVNARVIIDVIPMVEMIIGPQPPVPELGPTENENRFKKVFIDFLGVFVSKQQPLIIFLDDLQWADLPTLILLERVLTGDIEHLLVIGAFRDNEVSEAHPLTSVLNRLMKRKPIRHISLKPLQLSHVNALIADTLNCSLESTKELANLVLQKTAGNPFFTTMFLTNLARDGLVRFDPVDGQWKWDIRQIYEKNITSNVVEMMTNRIQRLSSATQTILSLAASIGNKFDLNVLSVIYQQDIARTAEDLWPAVQDGLVLQFGDETLPSLSHEVELFNGNITFAWMHDRVQQAAYELVNHDERKRLHLKIGRLLLENVSEDELEDKIFDILSHFKVAIELLTDSLEKQNLAQLFLLASQRAKDSSAFDPACDYATHGIKLLPENGWSESYELTFLLRKQHSECEYLRGNFELAETLYPDIISHCRTTRHIIETLFVQMSQYEMQQRFAECFKVANECLKYCNFPQFPFEEKEVHLTLIQELAEVELNLAGRSIEDLLNAPRMVDPDQVMIFKILICLFTPVYCIGYSNSDLLSLTCARMCNYTLKNGNCDFSAVAFSAFSFVAGFTTGDYEKAYRFARLGLSLMEKYPNEPLKCRSFFLFGIGANNTFKHVREGIPFLDRSKELALSCGDLPYATYVSHHLIMNRFYSAENLQTIQKVYDHNIQFMHKTSMYMYIYAIGVTAPYRCHMNQPHPISKAEFLQEYTDIVTLSSFYSGRLQCAFWKDRDLGKTVGYADKVMEYIDGLMGLYGQHENTFICAMVYLNAFCSNYELSNSQEILERINRAIDKIEFLAKSCPSNFLHKLLLLKAEKCRMDGNYMEALTFYEHARQSAAEYHFMQYEALANEMAGKFWLTRGMHKYAKSHIQEAYYLYNEWGSRLKVTQLRQVYPEYVSDMSSSQFEYSFKHLDYTPKISPRSREERSHGGESPSSDSDSSSDSIDLLTVMKASKTISMDLSLEQFLDNMMRIVIESSGAQRGVFFLAEGNSDLLVVADGNAENIVVDTIRAVPLTSSSNYPQTIINYVARTKETVIVGDRSDLGQFENDPFLASNKIKSILCAPIMKHNKFKGVIYLNNNLLNHAFNDQRAKIIGILAAQMAILLENAKFSQLLESEKKYRALASELEMVKKRLEEYIDVLCHELRNPLNAILGNTQMLQDSVSNDPLAEKIYGDSVNAITISAHHLKDIVDSVLNLSMLENQSIKLQSILFQPVEIIHQVMSMFKGQLQGKSIKLTSNVADALQGVVLRGDPYRLKEILINLISNSIKFTKEGSITVSCSSAPATQEGCTTLMASVEDSGIGMTQKEQVRLFKPFSQASKETYKEFGGSGLGLKISKDLVEAFGGSIGLESEKGKGTKFFFHVILKNPSDEEVKEYYEQQHNKAQANKVGSTLASASTFPSNSSLSSSASSSSLSSSDQQQQQQEVSIGENGSESHSSTPASAVSNSSSTIPPKKILVVEDNPINSKLLVKILRLAGHECQAVSNGVEAVSIVGKEQFDLVLMDIEMPIMGGLDATKAIRRREQEKGIDPVPIIGVSANARQQFKEDAEKSGMQSYITKPYLKQDIYEAVRDWAR